MLELSQRQTSDVALLVNGGFSPLDGFTKQADYDGIGDEMRTTDGDLFGLPVFLNVKDDSLAGKKVLLKYNGTNVAVLDVEEVWKPNKVKEAASSFGTTSRAPPVQMQFGGGFLNLGTPELIVIGAVAWALLGPKELFKLAREAGTFLGEWQQLGMQAKQNFQDAIESELVEDEK
jgi:hypothetical protein